MKQNTSNSAKKGARRGAGQAVAAMVMALAVAVGGVGTTALLAAQPVGLTVEPSTIQWEDDSTRPAPIRTRKNRSRKSPRSRRRAKLQRSSPQSPKPRARQLLWKKKRDPQRPA